MKIQQLSVFLENKPGRLSSVCNALAAAGINLSTLTLADTHQFGILRLIVQNWQEAKKVLEDGGYTVTVSDVVAVAVADRPGGLASILSIIESAGISVEYMYAFTVKCDEHAVLVFRFDQMDKAVALLKEAGVQIITADWLKTI
ncbi:MAG TPA: ACT domain-containing protein [Firmicutes bacterium]|nr:ACT domain-containing protein [Bacillota bacterium]